jgi:putative FmdB family regulatory protein
MPLYEYRCAACGNRFELIQKFSDAPPDQCPKCGKGPAERLMSSPAIQFKGTGWYITDYAKKGGSDGDSASAAKSAKTETDKSDTSEKKTGPAGDAGAKKDPAPAAASKTSSDT